MQSCGFRRSVNWRKSELGPRAEGPWVELPRTTTGKAALRLGTGVGNLPPPAGKRRGAAGGPKKEGVQWARLLLARRKMSELWDLGGRLGASWVEALCVRLYRGLAIRHLPTRGSGSASQKCNEWAAPRRKSLAGFAGSLRINQ